MQDHAHFMGEGRVVTDAVGNGAGHDVAVAVFVLQTFAVERGAPGSATQQEAARLHVAGRPGQVTDALEAEHRVVHVERHHDAVAG